MRIPGRSRIATLALALWTASVVLGPFPRIYTMYSVEVLAVYKASGRVSEEGMQIRIRRRGGTRQENGRLVAYQPTNYPLFSTGERFIMFLRERTGTQGIYYTETTFGPDSMFQVDDGKLVSPGPSRLSRVMVGDGVVKLRQQLLSRRGGQ